MPISDYVPPDTPTNNDYLPRIAGGVDPEETLDPRMTNNDLLRIIAEGTGGLAHLDSPALTGTPTAPTADAGDESAQIATTEFVQQEITANPAHLELMSPTTIGGAKLGDGLTITDGALGIDPTPQESTGEVRGAIASLTAKGWATQESTTGKNLYRETIYAVGQTWSPVNTLTVTKRGYNEYSISGNSTGTHWLYGGGGDLSDGLFVNLGAGTYVVSISGDASNLTIAVRGRVNGAQTTIASGASPLSFTLAEATDVKVTVVTIANKTFSNQRCTLQLELGSTPTSYEPYSGCAPSPSPDWAQRIQVASGRNLLDAHNTTVNWLTIAEDGKISKNSNAPEASYTNCSHFLNLTAGTYIITPIIAKPVTDGNTYAGWGVYLPDNTNIVSLLRTAVSLFDTYSPLVRTITLQTDTTIGLFIRPNGAEVYFQLELGSTPTPYVPYGHVGVEATCEVSEVYKTQMLVNELGVESSNTNMHIISCGVLSAGSYSIDLSGTSSSFTMRAHAYTPYGTWVRQLTTINSSGTGTFTLDSDALVRISTRIVSTVTLTRVTPVPLPAKGYAASLPNGTADVLIIDGAGKVEWELFDDEVTFDGSESGWLASATSNIYYNELPNGPTASPTVYSDNSMCDRFEVTTERRTTMGDGKYEFEISSTKSCAYFKHGASADLAAFKTWLASNPVTVLYPLATPATEQCGYIDWPDMPDGATVTCPELDALGVRYLIGNGVSEMARDWYERGHAETQATSTAIGELAQSVLDVDGKADAVAAQLVATDVSSHFTPRQAITLPYSLTTTRALKFLDFIWLNFAFYLSEPITFANTMVWLLDLDATVEPSDEMIVFQTSRRGVGARLDHINGGGYLAIHADEGVTLPANQRITVTGVYYVG